MRARLFSPVDRCMDLPYNIICIHPQYFGGMNVTMLSKSAKPRVEDVLRVSLNREMADSALDFVDFLRALNMSPQWASTNSWAASYKGKRICYVKVTSSGGWYIRPAIRYDEDLHAFCLQEGLISIMLDNVHHCIGCGKCAPGKAATFFGHELENVCCSPIDFEFHDPDALALDCAKKILLYHRAAIAAASTNSKGR